MTENFNFIKDLIFNHIDFNFEKEIKVTEYNGVKASYDGNFAVIGCNSKITLCRALFLFALNFNYKPFEICEKAHFDMLGVKLDVARNGVLKVDTVKEYILNLACLGFTHISFNIEDVFELKDYPRFGYMRGRYTVSELKKMKEYADIFGIEFMPSLQTLGHMGQYLKWQEASAIKDTSECLLVDEKKTYDFLEAQIKLMREIYDSKYIHLGLDEAHDLGTGKFFDLHGYEKRYDIFLRHANKVFEICKKYDFKPIMASDMLYRANSKTRSYYDKEVKLSSDMLGDFPKNVVIDYWDYYHTDKSDYDFLIKEHQNLERELILSGSIWTWEGFIEDTRFTLDTSIPYLKSAIENKEKNFVVCMWGDFGSETNLIHSVGSLTIFSEYCYKGLDCSIEDIYNASEFLTKMPYENRLNISKVHSDFHDDYRFSKKLLYGDIFYNLVNIKYDYDKAMSDIKFAMDSAKKYMEQSDKNHDYYKYAYYLCKVTYEKCELINKVREAYKNNDKGYLKEASEIKMPQVVSDIKEFHKLFKADWLRYKKPNGLEVMNIRFGGICEQINYQIDMIKDYLTGKLDKICELEEDVIEDNCKIWHCEVETPSIIN